jgi:pyruvate/2-oxoglutarate dehydrogenase complex dihydrolipoamide acyltransferase (E2) component
VSQVYSLLYCKIFYNLQCSFETWEDLFSTKIPSTTADAATRGPWRAELLLRLPLWQQAGKGSGYSIMVISTRSKPKGKGGGASGGAAEVAAGAAAHGAAPTPAAADTASTRESKPAAARAAAKAAVELKKPPAKVKAGAAASNKKTKAAVAAAAAAATAATTPAASSAAPSAAASLGTSVLVSIEACKSWGAFKTRAAKVESALQKQRPGVVMVQVNKDRPGKGNFVVSVNERVLVELRGLVRPFPALKALDMDHVVKQVVEAVDRAIAA